MANGDDDSIFTKAAKLGKRLGGKISDKANVLLREQAEKSIKKKKTAKNESDDRTAELNKQLQPNGTITSSAPVEGGYGARADAARKRRIERETGEADIK